MNVQSAGKLEDLFIQKLSEKFKLTERGLKHAFAKYDKSRDGLLDIEELFTLAKHLLNGIKVEDIHRLVSLYDVNGDGKISFEELHGMLTNRDVKRNVSSMDQEELATPLPRAAAVEAWGEESEPPLSARSEVSDETSASASRYSRSDVTASSRSHVSINDQYAIDSRAGLYLKNLKTLLLKRAMTMRDEGQIPSQIRLSMHSNQLLETTAISLLSRAFRPYTFSDGKLGASAVEQTSGARIRLSDFCVSRADFTRVLRGFVSDILSTTKLIHQCNIYVDVSWQPASADHCHRLPVQHVLLARPGSDGGQTGISVCSRAPRVPPTQGNRAGRAPRVQWHGCDQERRARGQTRVRGCVARA